MPSWLLRPTPLAKVIEPLMMGGDTPWILYMVGAVLALILNWLGVPALAFCLGVFIPLHLNTPLLVGGAVAYFVANSSKDRKSTISAATVVHSYRRV